MSKSTEKGLWGIELPSTVVVISKRNSGKTVLLDGLLKNWIKTKRVDGLLILSATAGFNTDYTHTKDYCALNKIPCQVDDYDSRTVSELVDMQKKKPPRFRNPVLVLDDVIGTLSYRKDPQFHMSSLSYISGLFTVSRHYPLTIVMSSQMAKSVVTPTIRMNSDYILVSQVNADNAMTIQAMTNCDKSTIAKIRKGISKKPYRFGLFDNMSKSTGGKHSTSEMCRWKFVSVTPPKSSSKVSRETLRVVPPHTVKDQFPSEFAPLLDPPKKKPRKPRKPRKKPEAKTPQQAKAEEDLRAFLDSL